ncbi:hypothetical protein OsI_36559 [Oryza sativa Indica Group]|uniref:Uncharacterized protein n=1 Tax=Oryza sativa subsp. indica TaxID=39946 RepID=B8BL59_ORYSI|nr:hypothetical protein OsI_36559 [Oryza sativa Indica Group]
MCDLMGGWIMQPKGLHSWDLLKTEFGQEIDAHDAVFRDNEAPVNKKYAKYVGLKRDFRLVVRGAARNMAPILKGSSDEVLIIKSLTHKEINAVIKGLSRKDYEKKKELVATEIIKRLEKKLFPGLQDSIVLKESIDGLYCVGDSCFPGQGVIAVAFSGIMCAHRVAADIGLEQRSPVLDAGLLGLLRWLRTLA